METRNAIIESTFLGIEDHGIFTCSLGLDYGSLHQFFGMHNLSYKDYGVAYLRKILEVVGVNSWDELKDKPIRVKCEHTGVHAIGHIIEDKWFKPEKVE
jgi:hypothetical protein